MFPLRFVPKRVCLEPLLKNGSLYVRSIGKHPKMIAQIEILRDIPTQDGRNMSGGRGVDLRITSFSRGHMMSFVWLRNQWGKERIESAHAKKNKNKILPAVRDGRWVNRLDFLCLADITLGACFDCNRWTRGIGSCRILGPCEISRIVYQAKGVVIMTTEFHFLTSCRILADRPETVYYYFLFFYLGIFLITAQLASKIGD